MAVQNVATLPVRLSSSKYAIPALQKYYSAGNNVFGTTVAKFLDGGEGKLYGSRTLPKTYDGASAAKAVAVVSLPVSGTTGEKVRLIFAYHACDPRAGTPESKDPAAATESVAVSADVSAWTAKYARVVEFTLTATNMTAEDHIDYYLARDPTHADDNYANYVYVHELYLLCYY